MFYVPSTARSFRDGTPFIVPCEGREARFLHRSHRKSNSGLLHGRPLHIVVVVAAAVVVIVVIVVVVVVVVAVVEEEVVEVD